ncbi:Rrf2 family transcriptional regulator [Desulfococcaceae bacterium HSG8]|nr:Rrf2 family transcriptional regulator [Desulfococcaceae bacterium HSG8]
MRLTKECEYAVRCIFYLSYQGEGIVVGRKQIAKCMKIPDPFLGKIAQGLSRSGIIEIVQGPKGGLRLVVSPEKLTLLNVIESVMGEIFLNDCVLRPDSCFRSPTCSIHIVWEKARDRVRQTLGEASFAMLLKNELFPPDSHDDS